MDKMEDSEDVLSPWEIEATIEHLEISNFEEFGTKKWFEHHKNLMLLSQQSIFEVSGKRTEAVKEWFVSFQKIPILIHEAILISIWKRKVFPLLIELNGEPSNTFMLYSVFYHENIAISLLENILYHCDSIESLEDTALDLVDYTVDYVTILIFQNEKEQHPKQDENISCIEELSQKRKDIEFDIGIKCISILGYFARFLENLPLSVIRRMLSTHDIPYLLVQLIEKKPWEKKSPQGETLIYNSTWVKIGKTEEDKICKSEGQVWLGLRELLLNPKCGPFYEITDFRIGELMKLQKYLHEKVLDQIAPLIELRSWLSYLNISSRSEYTKPTISVEVIPQIRLSLLDKHHKKWRKLAKFQTDALYSKNIDYIRSMAQILSGAYDIDKMTLAASGKCALCNEAASKRCSKCKSIWYCGRQCQVKHWPFHRNTCEDTTNHQ